MLPPPAGVTGLDNKYWVPKFATNVVSVEGVTVCEIAPPSDQLFHTYRVPAAPFCGIVVAMECDEPCVQLRVCPAL